MYGTGAGAKVLQTRYDENATYQRDALKPHERIPEDLKDWDHAQKYLGKDEYYPDFLVFFQKEIEKMGYEQVVNEYLLKGDAKADDMLARLYAGMM